MFMPRGEEVQKWQENGGEAARYKLQAIRRGRLHATSFTLYAEEGCTLYASCYTQGRTLHASRYTHGPSAGLESKA